MIQKRYLHSYTYSYKSNTIMYRYVDYVDSIKLLKFRSLLDIKLDITLGLNFKGNNDEDDVSTSMEHGHVKISIRSPKTLFESEKNRSLISIQFNLFIKILVETINSNYIYF